MVAVATSVEETTRELVRTADLTVPSSVRYEVVVKGSVDSRMMFEVMVVLEEKVEGSMVLLPMTTRGSSSSVTVSTAAEPVRVAERDTDDVTGTDDVTVLPLLSVVVTAVCDVGVLDGDADVPVPDSEASSEVVASVVASVVGSEVGADVGVVSSLVVGVASVVGSAVGVVVSGCVSDVVGVVGSGVLVVGVVVGSAGVVVSGVDVGVVETLVLVVTPVPTTCRLGMMPWGMSWAAICAKPARAFKRTGTGVGRMAAII